MVIGQLIDALNSGRYDLSATSLMMFQTGGGCRASNYVHLLRKALNKAGYSQISVISVNFSGLEKSGGFKLTLPLLRRIMAAILYGDCLMLLKNQIKPYETEPGAADKAVDRWVYKIKTQLRAGRGLKVREIEANFIRICEEFDAVPIRRVPKVKVGIVGEIYVKYAALGNNNLEAFLTEKEDCEVRVPGLLGFMLYSLYNNTEDFALYGTGGIQAAVCRMLIRYLSRLEGALIRAAGRCKNLEPPEPFSKVREGVKGIIGTGVKMGEGWLLTAEMRELIDAGIPNIICTQPFGCLPNHISGKGMIRKLLTLYPELNIIPIDYDPGATAVNQENRIKLMLSMARERLSSQ